jgi:hypothetical protein
MPITGLCACSVLVGLILLVPAVPISLILLGAGKKRLVVALVSIPAAMIGLSMLLTAVVLALLWLCGHTMSAHPDRLFEITFGFRPAPETCVLEGYHELGQDYAETVMKFRTTRDVVDRIVADKFVPGDRQACTRLCEDARDNLPQRVRSWFLPPSEEAARWYIAEPFEGRFGHDEAVLCYDEQTQIAYFHWFGVD